MSSDADSQIPLELFLQMAAGVGLDTSDTERMEDLRRRVGIMRVGFGSLYEIDVSGVESPSAFIPYPNAPDAG